MEKNGDTIREYAETQINEISQKRGIGPDAYLAKLKARFGDLTVQLSKDIVDAEVASDIDLMSLELGVNGMQIDDSSFKQINTYKYQLEKIMINGIEISDLYNFSEHEDTGIFPLNLEIK